MGYENRAGLQVDETLVRFVEDEALSGLNLSADTLWSGLSALCAQQGPKGRALLSRRRDLQEQIDHYHQKTERFDQSEYTKFLTSIGYIVPEPDPFDIQTSGVDAEIAHIAGPQLVVPITNARYALNAANARWGNLYDALYGTDALGSGPPQGGYDTARGAQVIAAAKEFLDEAIPLEGTLWSDVTSIAVEEHQLQLKNGQGSIALMEPTQYKGVGTQGAAIALLFENNGLGIEIHVNPNGVIGASDAAHLDAIWLEAAVSTIMDCEDSVACVDGADKTAAYRNWLGLMRGDLEASLIKQGRERLRKLHNDRNYIAPGGTPFTRKGRSVMLIRNVGHLMTTPAVLDQSGAQIGEGLLDALLTVMIALHDLGKSTAPRNSETGAVYVVKPKMHGPEEVAYTCEIFNQVEDILTLPRHTVKIGIMDEERRTSVNLKACLKAAEHRVAFINTGFLDRTGDEIHTSMQAGPMVPKGEMKASTWIHAYEDRNVDIGLACGFQGRAQIGKGMWAMPDLMGEMMQSKVVHPLSGASCAWVPSPTAATLHAMHYHAVNVSQRQEMLRKSLAQNGPRAGLGALLTLPLLLEELSAQQIEQELDNNAQGILGYVVRWVDQGVGCSKVPDIYNVGLMEDRATCRISSQALANWLYHGVVTAEQVTQSLKKMAAVVDEQNSHDPDYVPMAPDFTGYAFLAAHDLIFKGTAQPSGYTEPLLHHYRLSVKETAPC